MKLYKVDYMITYDMDSIPIGGAFTSIEKAKAYVEAYRAMHKDTEIREWENLSSEENEVHLYCRTHDRIYFITDLEIDPEINIEEIREGK